MNWSVPAAIKWIRALEQFDLQYVEQPVPDFDLDGHGAGAARRLDADRRRRELHERALGARADQGRRLRRLRRLPVRGGRAHARAADRRARGGGGQVVRDRQLGRARRRDDGERPRRRRVAELPVRQRHPLSTAAERRPRSSRSRSRTARSRSRTIPASASRSTRRASRRSPALELRESPFYDDIRGRRAERRPDPLRTSLCGPDDRQEAAARLVPARPEAGGVMSEKLAESLFERRSAGANCSRRQARSAPARSSPAPSPGPPARRRGASRSVGRRRCRRAAPSPGRSSRIRACIAPFGAILTINHTAQRADVRLAARVGPEAEHQARARRELRRRQLEADRLERSGRASSSRTARSSPRPTPSTRSTCRLNPPLPGQRRRRIGQVPAIAGTTVLSQVQAADGPEGAGRPRLRLPRLGPLLGDRAEQHVPDPQPGDPGHRDGPVHARRLVRPERPRQLRQEPELLEVGPAVPRRGQLQDHPRRAVAHRGAARRLDRRRRRSRRTAPRRSTARRT